nr:MAG: ORF1 [TTV-like mini virus]
MPRFWRWPYRKRRRRFWRWRTRGTLRRKYGRYRRRKHYRRVRKHKKLKFLKLNQWQPRRVVKLKVTGTLPLYITTNDRVSFNLRLYEDEIAPHYVPSLGGYSITNFSLGALYQLFKKGRAWWTKSNNETPLIRYTGCTMYFYRAESSDYIVNYHNCGPLIPNLITYNSAQPQIMQLNNRHIIVRCKSKNYSKKPYKKVKIKPPSLFTNNWYFQHDFADKQLLLLMCSSMSLDRFYLHSNSISSTIGFTSLNTKFFIMHDFYQTTTWGYYPRQNTYLWSFQQSTPKPPINIKDIYVKNLIYLGSTNQASAGNTIGDTTVTEQGTIAWEKKMQTYTNNHGLWGNIFINFYLKGPQPVLYTTQHIRTVLTKENYPTGNEKLNESGKPMFSTVTEPFLVQCRYNPFPDTGKDNQIYFTDITNQTPSWQPPDDKNLQNNNLPLWIGMFGLIDYMKLTKTATTIDTKKVITIRSKFISGNLDTYVPIDEDVLSGVSPFRKDISGSDANYWHPKTAFQYKCINNFCLTGPGTIKLPPNVSAEAHCRFVFYFKLGGCTAPTKTIEPPEAQPVFPDSNNILQPNSLQSPEQSIESYLFPFDWRRDYITPKAAKRIKEYKDTERSVFESTGINLLNPQMPQESPSESDSSDEEKEKETLQLLLQQFKHQQRKYKRRILRLAQNLE